jgi:hypothetical protein
MSRAKKETYRVIKGLNESDAMRVVTSLEEMVQDCRDRQNCPNFASSRTQTYLPRSELFDNGNKDLKQSACVLRIGNDKGRTIRIIFDMDEDADKRSASIEKRCLVNTKSKLLSSQPWDQKYVEQLYTFIHVKLHGPCTKQTTRNEPEMSRLDKLEMHVEALLNMELDVNGDRNARLESRFATVEKHLETLRDGLVANEKRLAEMGNRLGKRQKTD